VDFLDTNLIIRFVTRDNPQQGARAARIFQELKDGTATVITSESVIVEAVQVLSSRTRYHLPRTDVRRILGTIIRLQGLKIAHKGTLLRALRLYAATNLAIVDALNVAPMERLRLTTILSFDRDFDRVPGITRQEP
jgi:predicted nucleic-acid-binding protein